MEVSEERGYEVIEYDLLANTTTAGGVGVGGGQMGLLGVEEEEDDDDDGGVGGVFRVRRVQGLHQ
jgi:hypothetical protein